MPPVLGPVSPSPMLLVILGGADQHRGLAIAEREQRDLVAFQTLLDHHRSAGGTEASTAA